MSKAVAVPRSSHPAQGACPLHRQTWVPVRPGVWKCGLCRQRLDHAGEGSRDRPGELTLPPPSDHGGPPSESRCRRHVLCGPGHVAHVGCVWPSCLLLSAAPLSGGTPRPGECPAQSISAREESRLDCPSGFSGPTVHVVTVCTTRAKTPSLSSLGGGGITFSLMCPSICLPTHVATRLSIHPPI